MGQIRQTCENIFSSHLAFYSSTARLSTASSRAFLFPESSWRVSKATETGRGGRRGARTLFVQTVYVAPHPPAALLAKMRGWNPASHPELKVYLHTDSSNFSRLQNPPDNSAVRYLTTATSQNSPDLQLSAAERKLLPGENFASVWTKILSDRARAGVSGQPPYDNTSPPVRRATK